MSESARKPHHSTAASSGQARQRARKFDPNRYQADRDFMREFAREAATDTTGNFVYKAIAEHDKALYPDLLS